MKIGKFLVAGLLVWFTSKSVLSSKIIPTDFMSDLIQSRIKRDDDYHVKCQQSHTGMFSFFAVPILLGDITIDFMQMIDVMVDVMVTATGEEGEEGDGNNNNNNNNNGEGAEGECESTGNNNNCNNNNNSKRKRKRRSKERVSQDFIDSVLDSFQDQPSNLTMMREYEKMAKTHLNRYFEVLGNKPREPKAIETALQEPAQISNFATDNLMIGPRSYPQKKKVMVESLVLQVMGRLQESFYDFKDYCAKIDNADEDCAILDTDWSSVLESIK